MGAVLGDEGLILALQSEARDALYPPAHGDVQAGTLLHPQPCCLGPPCTSLPAGIQSAPALYGQG